MKEFACSAMCNASKGLHESTTLEWFTKKIWFQIALETKLMKKKSKK